MAKPDGNSVQTVRSVAPLLGSGEAFGMTIDGVTYPLEGQPPLAKGGAWWPPTHKAN